MDPVGRSVSTVRARSELPEMLEMGMLIGRVRQLLRGGVQRELEAHGASIPSWIVLKHLAQSCPRTQRELSALTAQHPAVVSRQLDHLADQGLVRRIRDRKDRRCRRVEATARGRRALQSWNPRVASGVAQVLAPLSRAELIALRVLLRKVVDAEAASGLAPAASGRAISA